jgi:hypothetical protein
MAWEQYGWSKEHSNQKCNDGPHDSRRISEHDALLRTAGNLETAEASSAYGASELSRSGKKRLTEKDLSDYHHARLSQKVEGFAMIRAQYSKILSYMMVVIFPAALFAGDQPGAMLYSHGTALLNGDTIARSSAIFSGDLVQTSRDSAANINAAGSIVLVRNDSLVKYEGSAVELEHGGINISTSKLLATHAGDVTVSPATNVWTEFEVRDVDGTVQITARKGDLTISDDAGTTTLAQGQETTRDEQSDENKKKKKKHYNGAPPAAQGGIMSSPWAIGIGGAAIAGGAIWVLVQPEQPVSPSQ